MKRTNRRFGNGCHVRTRRCLVMERLEDRELFAATSQDFLYVGDAANDSVQKFDATTGAYVSTFVAPGSAGLHGPRGLVVSDGKLLVVNQNVAQPTSGAILRFDETSGTTMSPLVSPDHPNAPFAPRAIVVKDNVLYVADAEGSSQFGHAFPPILAFDATTGNFLKEIVPNACFTSELHPRGLVFGPDGMLYASYFSTSEFDSTDPPGFVLRFRDLETGAFEVVAANEGSRVSYTREITSLHNPEGIVFGPDGRLYVTSSHASSTDNGIVVLDVQTKSQVGFIDLGSDFTQALLFGPNDLLYVPITSGETGVRVPGSIRAYELATGTFSLLVSPLSGSLEQPWYLTFSHTDSATLAYLPESSSA